MTIKKKLLIVSIGLVAVSIVIVAFLGLYSILKIGKNIQNISSETMQKQIEKFLVEFTSSMADKNNSILENVYRKAGITANFTEDLLINPDTFSASGTKWKYDEHIFKGDNGQLLNDKGESFSVFIPNHVKVDEGLKRMIEQNANLGSVFPEILKDDHSAVAVWMVGLTSQTKHYSLYYPNIDLGNISPSDEKTLEQIFFTVADPENNPERKVVWTPVYDDPAGQGLMITASAPIYTQNGFSGVLGVDITLNTIINNIKETNPIEGSYFFLIDRQGRAIAMPEQAYQDILGHQPKPGEFDGSLNGIDTQFSPIIQKMKDGQKGSEEIIMKDRTLYITYTPLKNVDFSIGAVVDKNIALKAVYDLQSEMKKSVQKMILTIFLPSGVIIFLLTMTLAFFLSKSISNSLTKLRDSAIEVGKGNMDVKIEIKTQDEIGILAKAFNQMADDLKKSRAELEEYNKNLEEKVKNRTKALEEKMKETEEMNKYAVGRELKMIELKKEIEEMKKINMKKANNS